MYTYATGQEPISKFFLFTPHHWRGDAGAILDTLLRLKQAVTRTEKQEEFTS